MRTKKRIHFHEEAIKKDKKTDEKGMLRKFTFRKFSKFDLHFQRNIEVLNSEYCILE